MSWIEMGILLLIIAISVGVIWYFRTYFRTKGPAVKQLKSNTRQHIRPSHASTLFGNEARMRREMIKNLYRIPLDLDDEVMNRVITEVHSNLNWQEGAYRQVVTRALEILRQKRAENLRTKDTEANFSDNREQGVWLRYWYIKHKKDRSQEG